MYLQRCLKFYYFFTACARTAVIIHCARTAVIIHCARAVVIHDARTAGMIHDARTAVIHDANGHPYNKLCLLANLKSTL